MSISVKYLTKSNIFLFAEFSFFVGIILQNYINLKDFYLYFIIIAIIFLFIYFFTRKKYQLVVSILIFSFIAGIIYFSFYAQKHINYNLPYGKNIEFEGIVADYPDIREDKTKLTVVVNKIFSDQNNNLIGQKILIDAKRYPEYKYGDKLFISGLLDKPGNWSGFDYAQYLSRYDIFSIIGQNQFSSENALKMHFISSGNGNVFYAYIFQLRNFFQNKINILLSEPYSGLLSGILFGNKKSINNDLSNILVIVGISHIIVVSGYHATVITKIFGDLTQSWPRKLSFLVGTFILFTFVILTGAVASVIRASLMAWLFLLAIILGRMGNIFKIFVFTCLIMVLLNPLILLYDFGFQLSALSVVGLIFVTPFFEKKLASLGKIISTTLGATFGAQVMTLPILIYKFGTVSLIAPLANLLIVPFTPLVMGIGFIAMICASIYFWLGEIVIWPAWLMLKYIVELSKWLAKIPNALLNISFLNKWYYIFIIYLIIIVLVNYINQKLYAKKLER